jgi:hypothetical protein
MRRLLTAQSLIGAGMPPLTGPSMATFMQALQSLSSAYPNIQNAVLQGYVDQLYALLTTTPTNYDQKFPALYITYWYRNFQPYIVDLEGPWNCFCNGVPVLKIPPWPPQVQYPPTWKSTINSLITAWGQTPPSNIISQTGNRAIWAFEDAVLGPNWTNISAVTSCAAALWASQVSTVNVLLAAGTLGAGGYFFLLHLLAGLATGDAPSRTLAQRIVNATASSTEYPNDVFINQSIYSSLMYLADPVGAYGWNNQQLQAFVAAVGNVVVSSDPVSTAIRNSLAKHGKVLYSDASYPMVDPYNPAIGFNQRQTDTLYALDQARVALRKSAADPTLSGLAALRGLAPPPPRAPADGSTPLGSGDIPSLGFLARIQGNVGASPVTKASLTDFMAQLNGLSYSGYGAVTSTVVKGWLDLLYAGLMKQTTIYGQPVHALYIAYNYGLYVAANYEAWYEITGETYLNFMGLNAHSIPAWTAPTQSPAWSQAVVSLSQQWYHYAWPGNIIASSNGMEYQYEIDFQANLFDPANWKDAGDVITGIAPLWTAQSAHVQSLTSQGSLALSDAVVMLYLLIAMVNSASPEDRALGAKIANLPTSSPELPNDTFANQLTYFWLMAMADPLGNFTFTNAQLTAMVSALAGAVTNPGPGSQLLNRVFTQQRKILVADQSYPMQDPYNPGVGFTVRQTDTLAALNRSWATLADAAVTQNHQVTS